MKMVKKIIIQILKIILVYIFNSTFNRKNNHDFRIMLRHSLKSGVDSHGAIQFDWRSQ